MYPKFLGLPARRQTITSALTGTFLPSSFWNIGQSIRGDYSTPIPKATASNVDKGSLSGQCVDSINGRTFLERFYSVSPGNRRISLAATPFTTATSNLWC
ncbi:hypothetical protein BJV77DRAFT_1063013 [Russula vinacea]|nr:hypothetical protein BJV77DRAFT_1063013 [Russula vinacea]